MSLKNFHIAFITITVLSAWAFAAWCLLFPDLPFRFEVMGWGSLLGGIGLLVYGIRFLKKTKDVIT